MTVTKHHKIEQQVLEKSLKHLRLRDFNNQRLTRVPHSTLDKHISNNTISTKLIHQILRDNNTIFPEDLPIQQAIGKKIGLMWPRGIANLHMAAPLLHQYSTSGCPVNCGPDWTKQQIEAAINRGPHISACIPAARQYLIKQANEQVDNGFAKIIKYSTIRNNIPKSMKISPVAMIPHKTRDYRSILCCSGGHVPPH